MENLRTEKKIKISWRIPSFHTLLENHTNSTSPLFYLHGDQWYLKLDQHGSEEEEAENNDWIGLILCKEDLLYPTKVNITFALKAANGEKFLKVTIFNSYSANKCFGIPKYIKKSSLTDRPTILLPENTLTILCSITVKDSTESVVKTEELSDDLNSFLEEEMLTDVTFKVHGEEFKLHRNILAARSPVFLSMFSTEMLESIDGVVTLNDCEADIFRTFATYLYTGKIILLNEDNVFQLFEIAQKYMTEDLLDTCSEYLKKNITVENFCEIVLLTAMSEHESLRNSAAIFFAENRWEIILSSTWQELLINHTEIASEMVQEANRIRPP